MHIDFFYEALAIMNKMIPGKDNDEELYNNYLSYHVKDDNIYNAFSRYFIYKKTIIKQCDDLNSEIIPYFNEFIYQTPFIVNFYRFIKAKNCKDIKDAINMFFLETLQELTNQEIKELDLQLFLHIINSLELKDNDKLMAINFYVNGEAIYNLVIDEAKKIEKIIINNYHLIKDDIDKFTDYLQSINIKTKLNDILQFKYFKNDDFSIYISVFNYNQLLLNQNDENLNIYLGYLMFLIKDIKELNYFEDKKILSVLKVISEPTRYKIIKLLKIKAMYVQEIANEVGLTSATLVHHLEILLNENLIEIVENSSDKKRIFYQVNSNSINHFLNILGESLK